MIWVNIVSFITEKKLARAETLVLEHVNTVANKNQQMFMNTIVSIKEYKQNVVVKNYRWNRYHRSYGLSWKLLNLLQSKKIAYIFKKYLISKKYLFQNESQHVFGAAGIYYLFQIPTSWPVIWLYKCFIKIPIFTISKKHLQNRKKYYAKRNFYIIFC